MTFRCRGPDIPAATGEGDPHILSDGEKQTYCVGYKQWSLAKRAMPIFSFLIIIMSCIYVCIYDIHI